VLRRAAPAIPLRAGEPLSAARHWELRRRLALEGCKWDVQLQDSSTVARFPLLLDPHAWRELRCDAAALAGELSRALRELELRPELHAALAVPRRLRRHLRPPFSDGPMLWRFDFHFTTEGWRISEVNADVPGGFAESSLLPRFFGQPLGDPTQRWCQAIARAAVGKPIALLSAPGWLEDHQVISWLARHLDAHLATPSLLQFRDGCVILPRIGEVGAVVRFHQAEWLREPGYFRGAVTPIANPGRAILVESKRFPLIWDALSTPLPTWRRLLPETRERAGDGEWVYKAPYCNTGDEVRFDRRIKRDWIAQRRFVAVPVETPDGPRFPCLGVYVLEGEAIGVYGRLSRGPIVDWSASDVAVLADE